LLYQRLVEPLILAALNIDPPQGSARLAAAIVRETLAVGGRACRPLDRPRRPRPDADRTGARVSATARGDAVHMEHQLRALALPPAASRRSTSAARHRAWRRRRRHSRGPALCAAMLVRGLEVPNEFRAIVNAHFRIEPPPADLPPILGVLNATTQWLFSFPGRVSVTISAGDRLIDSPREELAKTIWSEVARVTGSAGGASAVADRARAARHLCGNAGARRQAPARPTNWRNLVPRRRLDRYRLPATIEGAIRSGNRAADDRSAAMTEAVLDRKTELATEAPLARTLLEDVEQNINKADAALLERQRPDGHWVFELEADATIPAEYVLLRHYLGEPVDAALEAKIAVYLRRIQGAHGGWPLFRDGDVDISATVKAYFALKMIGDSIDADHMRRAREAVRARGGAARANVFTRIMLALFGFIPWRAVPVMPVEIMLLPKWFPFHLDKISYWSRTVIVPLLVLMAKKPVARNAKGVRIDELFLEPPHSVGSGAEGAAAEGVVVLVLPRRRRCSARQRAVLSRAHAPRAIDRAVAWVNERLNGEDGLGAIFRRWPTA
jgi:hypothetical protein